MQAQWPVAYEIAFNNDPISTQQIHGAQVLHGSEQAVEDTRIRAGADAGLSIDARK